MDNIFDKEAGTELAKHLRLLLTQCIRALDNKQLTEEEKKMLSAASKKASDILRISGEEHINERRYEESLKKVDQQLLSIRSNLAVIETKAAKLRSEYNANKFALEMSHTNADKFITLRRSSAIETNAIIAENQRINQELEENRAYWKANALKLIELQNRLEAVCDSSPKMKNTNKERQLISQLRDRMYLLNEQEGDLLTIKKSVEQKINGHKGDELEIIIQNIVKLFATYEKCYEHYTEKEEIVKKLLNKTSPKNAMDMSLADLNDTQVLLKVVDYEEGDSDEQVSTSAENSSRSVQEVCPVEVTNSVPRPTKFPSQPESPVASQQPKIVTSTSQKAIPSSQLATNKSQAAKLFYQPIANSSKIVNNNTQAIDNNSKKVNSNIQITDEPENVENQLIDEPMLEDKESEEISTPEPDNQALVGQEDLNIPREDEVFDTETVLNISQNSNDPGTDFLSLMQAGDKDKAPGDFSFNFGANFETDTGANGDGSDGFNFGTAFDFNSGGTQEASFNFNFDSAPSQENTGEEGNFFFNFD